MDVVRRCQAGDEEAFAELFRKYKSLVYKTAYLMLDDADEAEDVLQEVFVKVHRSLSTFKPSKGAFTSWLCRITANHCLNWRRKRRLLSLPLSLDVLPPSSYLPSPESQMETNDEEETVRRVVSRLSDKQRAVVILRYYNELPYAEIAQILNIPVGTVKSRLNLALKSLCKELGQQLGALRSQRLSPSLARAGEKE